MINEEKLRKRITKAIEGCKAYGTDDAQLIIFAYQNVLRWMSEIKQGKACKPTIGLFGNEVKNQIHKEMMDAIYERLDRLERFLNLMGDE